MSLDAISGPNSIQLETPLGVGGGPGASPASPGGLNPPAQGDAITPGQGPNSASKLLALLEQMLNQSNQSSGSSSPSSGGSTPSSGGSTPSFGSPSSSSGSSAPSSTSNTNLLKLLAQLLSQSQSTTGNGANGSNDVPPQGAPPPTPPPSMAQGQPLTKIAAL